MTTTDDVLRALAQVQDPDVGRPITDLDLVEDVEVDSGTVRATLLLTIPNHPYKDEFAGRVRDALSGLEGVAEATVRLRAMTDDERAAYVSKVRPTPAERGSDPVIPFAQMDSDTKVLAVASGKGGVGKSSITVNVAVALARMGKRVGILDADIWGYSIPRMMGATGRPIAFSGGTGDAAPTLVMPLRAHGCKVISIGFFIDAERPVIWRGPMLHRALQQFLADVFWGDLDYLLCDLPPGTGDIAISLAQMLPNADMLVVTTPQQAAQRVALRAGQTTAQTGMHIGGVIENMATFVAPDTGKEYRIFGEGGGELLAAELGTELLGSVPIDPRLREGADAGVPLVVSHPDAPASQALVAIARRLADTRASLVGKSLPLMG